MDLRTQLDSALKDAMRNGNEPAKRTVRMIISAIKFIEIEKGIKVDDAAIIAILHKEIKSRKEAVSEAEKAKRTDLIDANTQEIKIIESFLPKGLTDEELAELVNKAIAETGAAKLSDMGKVMKILLPLIQGRAANDVVSQAVKKVLQ